MEGLAHLPNVLYDELPSLEIYRREEPKPLCARSPLQQCSALSDKGWNVMGT